MHMYKYHLTQLRYVFNLLLFLNIFLTGEMEISKALEFTKHFENETEEIVWHILLNNVKRLHYFYREFPITNNSFRTEPAFQGFRVCKITAN